MVRALCRNQSKSANAGTSLSSKNGTKPMPPEGGPSVYSDKAACTGPEGPGCSQASLSKCQMKKHGNSEGKGQMLRKFNNQE